MPPATRRWLILIVLAGAVLRIVPIWFGLPYPHARPDEEVALGKAADVLRGELNPRFFHWPSLTFYLFAAALWVGRLIAGVIEPGHELTFAQQALIGRGVVAIAGAATILVLFHLARRITGDRTALIAAGFLAVALVHVRESHFAMTDVLMTLSVVVSLALLVPVFGEAGDGRPASRSPLRWCASAGLAAGLATSTKYNAAAVAVSMAAVQLLWFWRAPREVTSWKAWLPSLAYAAALIVGFLVGTPYAVLDYPTFSRDLEYDFTHLSQGHSGVELGRGWVYHLTRSLPYGVGIPVFVMAILGAGWCVRMHPRAALILGAFVAAFYAMIGSGQTVFFRYMLPIVPVVCLSAAIGVVQLADWLAKRLASGPAATLAGLLLVTAGPATAQSAWFDILLARKDTRVLAGDWLRPRLSPEDSLHDSGSNYTRLDLSPVRFHWWSYDASTNSFGDPDGRSPDWLVLQQSPVTAYAATPTGLRQLAQSQYVLVFEARGTRRRPYGVYDLQDAFFMPFSNFWTIARPGPDIRVYRRGDLPPIE